MTAAEKAEKAKQEAALGAAPAQTGLDLEKSQPAAAVVEEPAVILEAQTHEWVAELLESNQAVLESNAQYLESHNSVLESNQAVIEAVAAFKESANELIEQIGSAAAPAIQETAVKIATAPQFNPNADYEVAGGKEFRAPNDFTTIHKEGENVNHLGAEKLKSLLAQGLVVEVDLED
jgi:hypothetical protein